MMNKKHTMTIVDQAAHNEETIYGRNKKHIMNNEIQRSGSNHYTFDSRRHIIGNNIQ